MLKLLPCGLEGLVHFPWRITAHANAELRCAELGGGHRNVWRWAAAQRSINPHEEVIDLPACIATHHDREGMHDRLPLLPVLPVNDARILALAQFP
jgi:hypothetical protein